MQQPTGNDYEGHALYVYEMTTRNARRIWRARRAVRPRSRLANSRHIHTLPPQLGPYRFGAFFSVAARRSLLVTDGGGEAPAGSSPYDPVPLHTVEDLIAARKKTNPEQCLLESVGTFLARFEREQGPMGCCADGCDMVGCDQFIYYVEEGARRRALLSGKPFDDNTMYDYAVDVLVHCASPKCKQAVKDATTARMLSTINRFRVEEGCPLLAKLCRSVCSVCGAVTNQTCSVCKNVSYCSAACQRSGWRGHKKVCGQRKEQQQ